VFKVVAAVLHLGNVQFTEDSKESANLADEKDPDGRSNGTYPSFPCDCRPRETQTPGSGVQVQPTTPR
jgi:hypothetical protein